MTAEPDVIVAPPFDPDTAALNLAARLLRQDHDDSELRHTHLSATDDDIPAIRAALRRLADRLAAAARTNPARDDLHSLITSVAQREYEDSLTSFGRVAFAAQLGSRIAAEVMAVLDAGGLLLPPGTDTVEPFAALVTLDGEPVEANPQPTSREAAQQQVDYHAHQQATNGLWRGSAKLVHRHQHTTPWEPVDKVTP